MTKKFLFMVVKTVLSQFIEVLICKIDNFYKLPKARQLYQIRLRVIYIFSDPGFYE